MGSPDKKTVVVLGKGSLAIAVADWFRQSADYDLHCVVPAIPEPAWTASLVEWCRLKGVACVDNGRYEEIPGLGSADTRIDLVLSVYYGEIIAPWFFDCVGRTLNLHNSPLPKYRGCNPINWALKNGETTHGVTIHDMVERVDAGPIVSQVQFTIDPQVDEVIDVYNRTLAFGYTLFTQTIPFLDQIKPRPQDDSDARYYSRRDARDLGDRRSFTRAESSHDSCAGKTVSVARDLAIGGTHVPSQRRDAGVCSVPIAKGEPQ